MAMLLSRQAQPLPRLDPIVFFTPKCNTHASGTLSSLRFRHALLLLLLVLLPAPISLLQATHARLAGLYILHEKRVQLIRLHYR